jgi:uncharacterized membrane protein (UPF0182 family)
MDIFGITLERGLILIDVPFYSTVLNYVIGFWLLMLLINFVLGVLKRIPLL